MGVRVALLGLLMWICGLQSWAAYAQATPETNSANIAVSYPSFDIPLSSLAIASSSYSSPQVASTRPLPLHQYHSTWRPSSSKAMLYALIPGGGQVYNRKYWKVPIVLGAFTACTYAITWNASTYNDYINAYRDLLSSDPMANKSWQAYIPRGANPQDYVQSGELRDRLRRGSDLYRRNRNLSIILTVGLYALSILDAYVDAELYDFDISSDLSMRVVPDYSPHTRFGSAGYGLTCSFTFK